MSVPYDPYWYKRAVFYAIDVDAFLDSDGDGIGDFPGLTSRLDYLSTLGVTALWLLPFYPTPNRDNGYDISDYYGIDRRLGTPGDFVTFMEAAHARGIRVLIDLVVGHTSIEHPWFQSARRDPDSPYRDYYVWCAEHPDDGAEQVVFSQEDHDRSLWTYDEQAGAYYRHRFYDFEPDLNLTNPNVQREIGDIVRYWIQFGISGFRVDAAKYFGQPPVPPGAPTPGPHGILRGIYAAASALQPDVALLGEVDVEPNQMAAFFADGQELQLQQDFYLNSFLFLALAGERAAPIVQALSALPRLQPFAAWLNYVRNYDELDLEKLSEVQRQVVYQAFAPEPSMRIYSRGIRRRYPPMVDGDQTRVALAYSLILTLPGTPLILYGEEIGMGDDLALPGRSPVRTPMQWSPLPNAGFSTCAPERLVRPLIEDGPFGYQQVNVLSQAREAGSLLNWFRRALAARREAPELAWGDLSFQDSGEPEVLVFTRCWQGHTLLLLHNLAGQAQQITIDLTPIAREPLQELLRDAPYDAAADDPAAGRFALHPYGHRWFRFGRPAALSYDDPRTGALQRAGTAARTPLADGETATSATTHRSGEPD